MPDDVYEKDFETYTCGISKFQRRASSAPLVAGTGTGQGKMTLESATLGWRDGKGVAGGWDCVTNGSCTHLDGGAERGW